MGRHLESLDSFIGRMFKPARTSNRYKRRHFRVDGNCKQLYQSDASNRSVVLINRKPVSILTNLAIVHGATD